VAWGGEHGGGGDLARCSRWWPGHTRGGYDGGCTATEAAALRHGNSGRRWPARATACHRTAMTGTRWRRCWGAGRGGVGTAWPQASKEHRWMALAMPKHETVARPRVCAMAARAGAAVAPSNAATASAHGMAGSETDMMEPMAEHGGRKGHGNCGGRARARAWRGHVGAARAVER
jgi:hypothetical protein